MGLFVTLVGSTGVRAAELTVTGVQLRPGSFGQINVSGTIQGESTFGVTILLEIAPRPGNRGTVIFTPTMTIVSEQPQRQSYAVEQKSGEPDAVVIKGPPRFGVDVSQVGDPWPSAGTFTTFDTDTTGSKLLNGAVDDNGTFLSAPVAFSGVIGSFPVTASADASGVWDVLLFTAAGPSGWEGISTVLTSGTVTVGPSACRTNEECDDHDPCTSDTCQAGSCRNVRVKTECDSARQSDLRRGKEAEGADKPNRPRSDGE